MAMHDLTKQTKHSSESKHSEKLVLDGISYTIIYAGNRAFLICPDCRHHVRKEDIGPKACHCDCHRPSVAEAESLLNAK